MFGHPVNAALVIFADAKGIETDAFKAKRLGLKSRGVEIHILKRGGK